MYHEQFIVSDAVLKDLCRTYAYNLGSCRTVIFAVRGSLPELCIAGQPRRAGTPRDYLIVTETPVNYHNPRCTVGLWLKDTAEISLHPGSTIPSLDYLHNCPSSIGHYNMLLPGKYEFHKGVHPKHPEGYRRHRAFLMMGEGWIVKPGVIRRITGSRFATSQVFSRITYPGDNLHASRSEPGNDNSYSGFLQKGFSSSGCMTIAGQPREYVENRNLPYFWNSWEQFLETTDRYLPGPEPVPFLLFDFADLARLKEGKADPVLRYGSSGEQVADLQQILAGIYSARLNDRYYDRPVDGELQAETAKACIRFFEDYSAAPSGGEINLIDIRKKTRHFVFTLKTIDHVIN